jgi:dihydropteroate synthase
VAQDTFFTKKKVINCRGRLIDLSSPVVMGIVNITPDSFYSDSRTHDPSDAVKKCEKMLAEGATFIDLGAQSTRPGSERLSPQEEWKRLSPVLHLARKAFPGAFLSVDTFYSAVAKNALQEGADLINDVSGGTLDSEMFSAMVDFKTPYVLTHIKGSPQDMQANPVYDDVMLEIMEYFVQKLRQLKDLGINDVILDPGYGFGKTPEHNFSLLKNLELAGQFGLPVMIGVSRKSSITKILNIQTDEALNGTTVLHTIACMKGVDILRVHDVKEAMEVIKLVTYLSQRN